MIQKYGFYRATRNLFSNNFFFQRQPASTTIYLRPHLKACKIYHVDVLAWLRRLRVAPSRTSPISTIHSPYYAFARSAVHNHPTRRDIISAGQAGTLHIWIYLAVTDPSIKTISGLYLYTYVYASTLTLP